MNLLTDSGGVCDAVLSTLPLTRTLSEVAVTALWQGTAVAIAMVVLLRLGPDTSAAHRFNLWSAGFLVTFALPFSLILTHPHRVLSSDSGGPFMQSQPWLVIDARWSLILTGLWFAASFYRAADLGIHAIRLRSLWKSARPVATPSDCASLPSIQGRRPLQLCTTQMVERPSVIGFFAPRILIPEWLFARLTPAELDQIVLHEAEHLRRGDDWTNLLQKLSLIIFPLNPALAWMDRQLCLEREMACDDGVVRRTHAPRAYAECLASLAELGLQHRSVIPAQEMLSLGAWERRPELVQRVHSLLTRRATLGTKGARALSVALGCALVVGAAGLARCPQLVAFVPQTQTVTRVTANRTFTPPQVDRVIPVHDLQLASFAKPMVARRFNQGNSINSQPLVVRFKANAAIPKASPSLADDAKSDSPVETYDVAAERNAAPQLPVSGPVPVQSFIGQNAQAEGWIVLTTWEQVVPTEAPAIQTRLESHAQETSQNDGQKADQFSNQIDGQFTGQVKVTRMIFRVMPAEFVSAAPARTAAHNGWWVFQL